jgi:molybdopterin converting factor small subunit
MLRGELASRSSLTQVVAVATFLVNGQAAADDTPLPPDATVDVLPPFAGG